ncbi:TonB-dependent receptor [Alteromonas sp. NFXS44]|uniref:TonB-dependent receptor n=1 Tax=Alteromonas sp. NFXS44 TaxID=2818435 RepID=UPI0032DEBD01
MNIRKNTLSLLITSLLSVTATAQTDANVKDKKGKKIELETIEVTAERRVTSIQDTAMAISAVSGEELNNKGLMDLTTFKNAVTGLNLTTSTPSNNIVLRGIGAGGSSQFTTQSVQFSIFGVPLSRQHSTIAAFYDLERVELLKGPQGTLYGRNANVGALNLIPKRPGSDFEGNLNVTAGNYNTLNVNGGVSLPVNDDLAARVSFSSNHHDGYLSNGYNDANNQSLRVSMLYEPSDNFNVLFFYDQFNNNSKGPSTIYRYVEPSQEYQNPDNPWFAYGPSGCGDVTECPTWGDNTSAGVPFNIHIEEFQDLSVVDDDGFLNVSQKIYGMEINQSFSAATLTVIPALVETDVNFLNYGSGFHFKGDEETRQVSLEARLASNQDSKLDWLIGALYLKEDQNAINQNFEPQGYQILNTPNLDTTSMGLFGEVTYHLAEDLRLTAGLRYSKEEKSIDGFVLANNESWLVDLGIIPDFSATCAEPATLVNGPTTAFGNEYPEGYCLIPNSGEVDFDDLSYKLGIAYDITDSSLLYANIKTGFKSGGLNPGLDDPTTDVQTNRYSPEKLTSYEIGSKNRFFDNSLETNIELYYWDYEDQQIGVRQNLYPSGQAPKPLQADGNLYGAEVELTWLPTDVDTLNLQYLNVNGKYDFLPKAVNSSGEIGGLYDLDRTSVPKHTITADYTHLFILPGGDFIIFGLNAHYESEMIMRAVDKASLTEGDYREAYIKFNSTLTYESTSADWRVTAYIDNITDEPVINVGTSNSISTGIFWRPSTNLSGARYSAIEAPRTYGVRLSMYF